MFISEEPKEERKEEVKEEEETKEAKKDSSSSSSSSSDASSENSEEEREQQKVADEDIRLIHTFLCQPGLFPYNYIFSPLSEQYMLLII